MVIILSRKRNEDKTWRNDKFVGLLFDMKVEMPCVINKAPRQAAVWLHPFLISELNEGEWPASCPERFIPDKIFYK
jgi:hypothetical protein